MSIVVAVLDSSAAARPVLEVAQRIGEMTESPVEAVHVRSDPLKSVETPESLAARNEVPFQVLDGTVEPEILRTMDRADVLVGVIGARATTGGRRPVGRTTLHVIARMNKPVVVVPPDLIAPGSFRRLLVPLEGTEESSQPVLDRLGPLLRSDVEVVVLHVFTDVTQPAMLDRPLRDLQMMGREFLTRHYPHAAGIEFRPGPVAMRVAEVSQEQSIDLIVLSWSQDISTERARVVREVLSASALPVLLLPAPPSNVDVTKAASV